MVKHIKLLDNFGEFWEANLKEDIFIGHHIRRRMKDENLHIRRCTKDEKQIPVEDIENGMPIPERNCHDIYWLSKGR